MERGKRDLENLMRMWQKRPRELDHRMLFEEEVMTLQMNGLYLSNRILFDQL